MSHEFFHVWNVKRIRPKPLGTFDYRVENHTRQLWTMEGVTSYYEKRFVAAAGLYSKERFLERVAEDISSLAGAARARAAVARAVEFRRLDQALPAGRELGELERLVLPEGGARRR